jgi:hypothetical protein
MDSLTLEIIQKNLQHDAIADFNWYMSQEEREFSRLYLLTHHSRRQYPDALGLIKVYKNILSYYVVSLRILNKSIRSHTVI